ncbi:GIY-YIG nuclease family protein [Listeria costaricensis]|uniref:GIY-YIG nuclease family protein n=1 Tax=Listeria costaricensis TaxID=2026604 RepID=UPI000C07B36A|nr:GIY-YIG nuclease family protein [Listeria costaricensis]
MTDRETRKEKIRAYKEKAPDAGVYQFISTQSGKKLLGATMNLEGIKNKLAFGYKIGDGTMLPPEMQDEAKLYGVKAIEFEVVDRLKIKPEMTRKDVQDELTVLLELWQEKQNESR